MSRLAIHRGAIAALLLSVADIGKVHREEPFARSESEFRSFYLWGDGYGNQQVRGWFIHRTATLEREIAVGRTMNVHSWKVRGFMSFDSVAGTGEAFDELIESIRLAYRADPELGGAVDPGPMGDRTGIQVSDAVPVMFAGVLCHSASLQLQTHAYLNVGE